MKKEGSILLILLAYVGDVQSASRDSCSGENFNKVLTIFVSSSSSSANFGFLAFGSSSASLMMQL